ncbi:hypothetical protein ACP3P6_09145 [Enterobacter mori]
MTIRDLTGSVTKINTRATTISDWDRKRLSSRTRRLSPSSLSTGRCQTPSPEWC